MPDRDLLIDRNDLGLGSAAPHSSTPPSKTLSADRRPLGPARVELPWVIDGRVHPNELRTTCRSGCIRWEYLVAEAKLARYQGMRDFSKTGEPSGDGKVVQSEALRFVIQKHAASHLHFDLRLEYHGTFRSWAVPKGPSLDPQDRRLAMEVEDHPLDYGDFEGTIPKGQ